MLVKVPKREIIFSFNLGYVGLNASQARDVLKLQEAFASGGRLCVVHLDTGITVITNDFPEKLVSKPLDVLVEIANDLTLIQQGVKVIFPWPDKISVDDQHLIKKAVDIITKGESFEGKRVRFGFDKASAQSLAEIFSKNQYMRFLLDGEDRGITLFNQELKFGPTRIVLPRAKPTKKTIKRFSTVDSLDSNSKVQIELDVDDPGVVVQYLNWLPNKTEGDKNG